MNERWKDLIKQSIQEIGPEDKPSKEETLKRYAELIVQECARVELYWLSEQDRKAVAEKIKQHFGVEE